MWLEEAGLDLVSTLLLPPAPALPGPWSPHGMAASNRPLPGGSHGSSLRAEGGEQERGGRAAVCRCYPTERETVTPIGGGGWAAAGPGASRTER